MNNALRLINLCAVDGVGVAQETFRYVAKSIVVGQYAVFHDGSVVLWENGEPRDYAAAAECPNPKKLAQAVFS